jgi:hypothetical protein
MRSFFSAYGSVELAIVIRDFGLPDDIPLIVNLKG